jgi:HEAT repeat protein
LANYGTASQTAIGPLVTLLGESDERLRDAASDSLVQLGKSAVEPLAEALDSEQTQMRVMAAITLGKLGPEASTAIDRLKQARQDQEESVRQAASLALRKIEP